MRECVCSHGVGRLVPRPGIEPEALGASYVDLNLADLNLSLSPRSATY